jgi:hypothetical protein
MADILLAASPEPLAICRRMLSQHDLHLAETVSQAESLLEIGSFDLILCTVLFDESRMFDLLRLAKANRKWKKIPFVCARVRPTTLAEYAVALEGVEVASKALGAAAFLDILRFQSEAEMASEIERLTHRNEKKS